MSRTLTINGTANVDPATWDIRFETLDGTSNVTGTFSREIGEELPFYATISEDGSKIEGIVSMIQLPGDEWTYNFKIVNDGTIDASITSIINNTPDFLPTGSIGIDENGSFVVTEEQDDYYTEVKEEDMELYNKYFFYKLTYTDTGEELKVGDVINANSEKNVTVTVGFDESAPSVPKTEHTYNSSGDHNYNFVVNNLGTQIIYTQK